MAACMQPGRGRLSPHRGGGAAFAYYGLFANIHCLETRERGDSMELKVFKDTLTAAGGLCDLKVELPVETEILIPDYLPQVFKIVKCQVHPVVLQKQVLTGRLTLDGYLRCVVFYQSENDQSLCQTEQKLPFTKAVELPAGEHEGCTVHVSGEVEYLNCRAVNQRRVDVRGAYALNVDVAAELQQEVITAVADCGAEQKLIALSGIRNVASLDKLMSAEEELSFPQAPQAVLDITGIGHVQDVKLISGKAVVKGEIEAQVLYRTEPGYKLEKLKKAVPFNQIVDVDGVTEDCSCFAQVEPVGCTMLAGSGPEAPNTVSVTALLHLRVYRAMECLVVGDAFSTQYDADVAYKQIHVERLAEQLDQTAEVTVTGALPDENAEIIDCFASLAPVELVASEGQLTLRGRATAHVLCMNSLGEIDCYDKAFEYMLPSRYNGAPEDYYVECWPSVVRMQAQKSGKEMAATASIRVTGLVTERQKETVVDTIKCEEPLAPQDPEIALRIYYAQAGENVFDIAKRYHVSPAAMLKSNHLEQPELDEAMRLLVPVTV